MKQIWFKRTSWGYYPIEAMGFIISLSAILFMVPVCLAIFRQGHSASDNLYQVFVYGTCTAFWWKWIAETTSSDL